MAEWEFVREHFGEGSASEESEIVLKNDKDFREDLESYLGSYTVEILRLISVNK